MRTVLVCGTFKVAESLKHWLSLLPDVSIYRLPNPVREAEVGHTVAGYAAWLEPRVAEADLVIGQSLGGTVALCTPTKARVVAVDPPLSTDGFAKALPAFMRAAEGPLDYPEIWRFLFDVYGIRREGGLEPRDYHPRIQAGEVIACTVGSLLCEGDVRRLTGVR